MAINRQNKEALSPQPILAKLWWASLPVFIATQGVVGAATPSPEHFWSFDEDAKISHRRFLQGTLEPTHHRDQFSLPPNQATGSDVDINWFTNETCRKGRFQVSAEVAQACCNHQNAQFDSTDADGQSQNYLCNREIVHKVAAVASAICAADGCQASVSSAASCINCNDAIPNADRPLARYPALAVDGPCQLSDSQACYAFVSNSPSHIADSREVVRPTVSDFSHIPFLASAYHDDVLSAKSWSHHEQKAPMAHALSMLPDTEIHPQSDRETLFVPVFLTSPSTTHFALASNEEGDAESLHWQLILADSNAINETSDVDHARSHSLPRDIPYLLCEGCDVTTADARSEETGPSRVNKRLIGSGRASDDLLARAEAASAKKDSVAYLQQPLTSDGFIVEGYHEDPSVLWLSAQGPTSTSYRANANSCIGAECEHEIGSLTEGHPTAAYVAFGGTGYHSIEDIGHISSFACTELSPADPRLYCDREVVTAPVGETALLEVLDHASDTFLVLANDVNPTLPQGTKAISRSSPDKKSWGSVKKLALPSAPQRKEADVATEHPSTSSQEIPNFWSVLDQLVESREPAAQIAVLPEHAVVATESSLLPRGEILASAPLLFKGALPSEAISPLQSVEQAVALPQFMAQAPSNQQQTAPQTDPQPQIVAQAPLSTQQPVIQTAAKPQFMAQAPSNQQQTAPQTEPQPQFVVHTPLSFQQPATQTAVKPQFVAEAPLSPQQPATQTATKPQFVAQTPLSPQQSTEATSPKSHLAAQHDARSSSRGNEQFTLQLPHLAPIFRAVGAASHLVASTFPENRQYDFKEMTGSPADLYDSAILKAAQPSNKRNIVAACSPQQQNNDGEQNLIGSADNLDGPAFLSPKLAHRQPNSLAAASSPHELNDIGYAQTTIGSTDEPALDDYIAPVSQLAAICLPMGSCDDQAPKAIGSAESPYGPSHLSPLPNANAVSHLAAASAPEYGDLGDLPMAMGSSDEPVVRQVVPLPAPLTVAHHPKNSAAQIATAPLPLIVMEDHQTRAIGSADEPSANLEQYGLRSLTASANAQGSNGQQHVSNLIGDIETPAGSCVGPNQHVAARSEGSSNLQAFAQPLADGQIALLTQEEAEALGLISPGIGREGLASNEEGSSAIHRQPMDMAVKTVEVVSPILGGALQACKQAAPLSLAGGQANAPVCALRQYPQIDILGQTQRPAFDASEVKQLAASAQPKDLGVLANRKAQPLLWAMSPGPGHQHITPQGKVPGGLDIASGRCGKPNIPNQESIASQIRSLQGGYYYYIGEGTGSSLSTSLDHLQVSGLLSRLPGTASELPGLTVGADKIGIYDEEAPEVRSQVQLATNLEGTIRAAGSRSMNDKAETIVSLAKEQVEGLSGAMGRADLRTGKQKPAFAKVVDATVPPKSFTQSGKAREGEVTALTNEHATHRFAVEVVPHVDASANPSMHQLVGQASPRSAPPAKRESSLFMNFAHASDSSSSVGYEPNAFLSVGASSDTSHFVDDEDYDNEEDTDSIGAVSRYHQPEEEQEYYVDVEETTPRGAPGVDSYRQSTAMGVRRDGLLWDNNKPWLNNQDDEVVRISERTRPPDKAKGNPLASGEASEDAIREMDISLQKKNRTIASEAEQSSEGAGSLHEEREADVPTAALGQSDGAAGLQSQESADTSVAGWEQPSITSLNPAPTRRDLDPRRAIDRTIVQDTLFESAPPKATPKSVAPAKDQPNEDKPQDQSKEEKPKEEEPEPEGLLINFRDVGMTEYIRFVAQQTGKNFLFNDDDLQFNITIISEQPTSLDNIMAALLQELRIHGLQVIEQGNNIIIHKNDKTRGPTRVIKDGKDNHETQLVTRVFQLNSIPAVKMKDVVVPMLSAQALVQILSDTNNLLITDFGDNVAKIGDLIHSLDTPSTAYEIGQYVGRNNFIENLIPLAEEIIKPFTDKQSLVFVPHLSTNSVFIVSTPLLVKRTLGIFEHLDSLEGSTKILTLEDLSKGGAALTKQQTEEEKESRAIEKLKQEDIEEQIRAQLRQQGQTGRQAGGPKDLLPSGKGTQQHHEEGVPIVVPAQPIPEDHISHTKFYIHKLQYRQGDQLQDALTRISDSLRLSEKANIDLVNAINSIQWIESSNSLVVTGTADALGRVKELIDEIDVPLRQILLEMLILDTTISDSLTYAVDFVSEFSGTQVAGVDGFSGGQPTSGGTTPLIAAVNTAASTSTSATTGITSAANAMISAASLAGVSTPGFNLGIIGRRILRGGTFFNTMGALVQALHGDTNSEIVLNPKIIVEDNNEAEIFVGETIAFQTQNVVNDTGTIVSQNVEYRDVGTRLKVRPQIGNNNIVTLEIEEEVSQTAQQASGGTSGGSSSGSANVSPGPTTSTSRTITKVHVPNEFFVVLSGMIRDEKNRSRNQVPCLGGLPIIGAFSSRKDNSYSKRNLMIFIRPQIIDTEWDFDDITRTQQNIYKDKRRMKPRWKYEADEGLDFLNLPRINEHCEDDNYIPGYTNDMAPSCPYYPTNR